MRRIFTILSAIIISINLYAQTPEKMSYQAVIRNSSNQLMTNTAVGMRISILHNNTSGPAVYVETQSPTTNANGLISIEIGSGNPLSGDFSAIDWGDGTYYLKTETDPTGGTNYSITGVSQLLSVPYALHAKTADSIAGGLNNYTAGNGIDIINNTISEHKYKVGDFAQGGVVFWVDETGEHGLVCAKEDQDTGTGIRWYAGTYTNTMARGDGPYAGKLNTAIIIANQGQGNGSMYAARACNELEITEGGKTYGDWYLPSKAELMLMYQNKAIIDSTASAHGGAAFGTTAPTHYWTSTEHGTYYTWRVPFDTGVPDYQQTKSFFDRVRAVRAF